MTNTVSVYEMDHPEMQKRAVLVYQAGIANVFEVDCFNGYNSGRNAKRLIQSDFRSCENFARGLAHAGYSVASEYCNQAGDISESHWEEDLNDAPFSESFHPVFNKVLTDYNYNTVYDYRKPF